MIISKSQGKSQELDLTRFLFLPGDDEDQRRASPELEASEKPGDTEAAIPYGGLLIGDLDFWVLGLRANKGDLDFWALGLRGSKVLEQA